MATTTCVLRSVARSTLGSASLLNKRPVLRSARSRKPASSTKHHCYTVLVPIKHVLINSFTTSSTIWSVPVLIMLSCSQLVIVFLSGLDDC
jgi:hypothetical protein